MCTSQKPEPPAWVQGAGGARVRRRVGTPGVDLSTVPLEMRARVAAALKEMDDRKVVRLRMFNRGNALYVLRALPPEMHEPVHVSVLAEVVRKRQKKGKEAAAAVRRQLYKKCVVCKARRSTAFTCSICRQALCFNVFGTGPNKCWHYFHCHGAGGGPLNDNLCKQDW